MYMYLYMSLLYLNAYYHLFIFNVVIFYFVHEVFILFFPCFNLAVKSIKKQHLVEVKSLPNPPPVVKIAIESICTLLGETDLEWKSLRSIIMRENFISTIVHFTTDDIS